MKECRWLENQSFCGSVVKMLDNNIEKVGAMVTLEWMKKGMKENERFEDVIPKHIWPESLDYVMRKQEKLARFKIADSFADMRLLEGYPKQIRDEAELATLKAEQEYAHILIGRQNEHLL